MGKGKLLNVIEFDIKVSFFVRPDTALFQTLNGLEEMSPNVPRLASAMDEILSLMMMSGSFIAIGTYSRSSEVMRGIAIYLDFGCRISPNSAGLFASFRVTSLRLSARKSFTALTRLANSGEERISFGVASISHKQ